MAKPSISNKNNHAGQESSNIYSFANGQAHKQKQSAHIRSLESQLACTKAQEAEAFKRYFSLSTQTTRLLASLSQAEDPDHGSDFEAGVESGYQHGLNAASEPEDIEDTFDSGWSLYDEQHLKFGLQKHVFTRRVHLIKRGPWASFPDHGPRKWIQPSDHVLTRYPDYHINARYPDCEDCS